MLDAADIATPAAVQQQELAVVGLNWPAVWREALSDKVFLVGAAIVIVALLLAALGPYLATFDVLRPDPTAISQPPSGRHWLGTDNSGLDVFSRVIASPRIDVTVALSSALVSLIVGSVIGLVLSYFATWYTASAMRILDVLQAFPVFVLAMMLVVTAGRSLVALIFVVAFLNVPIYVRLMRSQVLTLRQRGFVEAARAVGVPEILIAFRHVYPNAIAPCLVQSSITMGWAIILIAGLSFIGAGIRPPTPEWGAMISIGANQLIAGEWWSSAFPGIAMALTVFGFAALGEQLNSLLRRQT